MKLQRWKVVYVLMFGVFWMVQVRAGVQVWELPEHGQVDIEQKKGWKLANESSKFAGGAVVENEWMMAILTHGSSGPVIRTKLTPVNAEVRVFSEQNETATISKVRLKSADELEAIVVVTIGKSEIELILQGGRIYVGLVPVSEAVRLEMRAPARYAIIPTFTSGGNDILCEPTGLGDVVIEGKPMLLELLEGKNGMLALIWDATIVGKDKEVEIKVWETRKIALRTAGEGTARRFASVTIDFNGKPLYLGVLQGSNLWDEVALNTLPAGKTTPVEWKRPFDAIWRANFVEEVEKNTVSWTNRVLTFYFKPLEKDGSMPLWKPISGSNNFSTVWPCIVRGSENLVTVPLISQDVRSLREGEGKHHFGRMVVYVFDRTEKTPLDRFGVEDMMRHALGTGPCDLEWWRDILK